MNNMKMIMQNQNTRMVGGELFKIGEDARPFADDGIIIVADGLGGRGGWNHTTIKKELVFKDKFYDMLIRPLAKDADEQFEEFVLSSFSEFFEFKDKYFVSAPHKKTSSYFASRFVTAMSLYALKYDENFNKKELFAELEGKTEEEKNEIVKAYADKFAEYIRESLTKIAEAGGFEKESKHGGTYLFPTTLVIALVNEREDDVEVVYLWAGDSRGYIWDKDGLAQVTDDHEEEEVMTNLITLSKPFKIETRIVTNKKPCLVFNMTDGIYKCHFFASPFDLEGLLLYSHFVSADSFEQLSELLRNTYSQYGKHDDSNTLGLLSYGYEDYAAVKAAAQARIDFINNTYVAQLPDILERDYKAEYEQKEDELHSARYSVKSQIEKLPAMQEYLKQYVVETRYRPYETEKNGLIQRKTVLAAQLPLVKNDLVAWVEKNWIRGLCVRKYTPIKDKIIKKFGFKEVLPYDYYANTKQQIIRKKEDYKNSFVSALRDYEGAAAKLATLKDYVSDLSKIAGGERMDEWKAAIEQMQRALSKFKEFSDGKIPELKSYKTACKEIHDFEDAYIKTESVYIEEFANKLLNGEFDVNGVSDISEAQKAEIVAWTQKRADILSEIAKCEENMVALPEKYAPLVWKEQSQAIIDHIFDNHKDMLPEELQAEISEKVNAVQTELDELKHCLEKREEIYRQYEEIYNRLFKESAL